MSVTPFMPPHLVRPLIFFVGSAVLPAVCGAQSADGPSSAGSTACENQTCLPTGSVIPLSFLVLFFLILVLWCALHVCCNIPCCCCCGCKLPPWRVFHCCASSPQAQVHTHLHAEDIPLTHPILASPAAHLAPLVRPPPTAAHYRPYKGSYRIGKNHHLQPFTLNLHLDYNSSPRTMSGHGVDDGQSFTVTDASFTVDGSGSHRCVFVERFSDGSRYVFYGVWEGGWDADERWSGFWLRESGVQQQGTFSFQYDEAAEEQINQARQAGETDVDGWMERRMREQLAARERRYIVLRGLEERKEAADSTATARHGERREEGREATAIEIMERRLNRPTTAALDGARLEEVTVDVAVEHDAH